MVKCLSDISKGFLIAMLAGTATGKLEGPCIMLYLPGAVLTFAAAYFPRRMQPTMPDNAFEWLGIFGFIGSVLIFLSAYVYNRKHRVRR